MSDPDIATDEEIAEIEHLAGEHSVLHWAGLLRIINRMRKAEAEMAVVRAILASTDIGSLPNDYPIERMAEDRMAQLKDLEAGEQ